MSHKASKCWVKSLNGSQKKYLLRKYGSLTARAFNMDVEEFDSSKLDTLMKKYQNDSEFNSLGSNISSINLNLKDLKL